MIGLIVDSTSFWDEFEGEIFRDSPMHLWVVFVDLFEELVLRSAFFDYNAI